MFVRSLVSSIRSPAAMTGGQECARRAALCTPGRGGALQALFLIIININDINYYQYIDSDAIKTVDLDPLVCACAPSISIFLTEPLQLPTPVAFCAKSGCVNICHCLLISP